MENLNSKDIIKEWIDALRSGKYEQGKFQLKDKINRFCCLGVLCEVLSNKGLCEWKAELWNIGVYDPKSGEIYCNILPPIAYEFTKLLNTESDKLMKMNDSENKSFTQIADYIEQNILSKKNPSENQYNEEE